MSTTITELKGYINIYKFAISEKTGKSVMVSLFLEFFELENGLDSLHNKHKDYENLLKGLHPIEDNIFLDIGLVGDNGQKIEVRKSVV